MILLPRLGKGRSQENFHPAYQKSAFAGVTIRKPDVSLTLSLIRYHEQTHRER